MKQEKFEIGSGYIIFFPDGSYSYTHEPLTQEQKTAVEQVFMCYRRKFYTRRNVVDELRRITEVKP